jgi:hypothetical protein
MNLIIFLCLLSLIAACWVIWRQMAVPFGMAISISKDVGEIAVGGGNIMYVKEVKSDGTDLASPDTWHVWANLISSKFTDTDERKDIVHEDASRVTLRSTRKVGIEGTTSQVSKAIIATKEEMRGKFYAVYYQDAPLANGKVREYYLGICQGFMNIEKENKDATEQTINFSFVALKNNALISVPNASLPSVKKTAGAMDVAAGAYYSIAET